MVLTPSKPSLSKTTTPPQATPEMVSRFRNAMALHIQQVRTHVNAQEHFLGKIAKIGGPVISEALPGQNEMIATMRQDLSLLEERWNSFNYLLQTINQ